MRSEALQDEVKARVEALLDTEDNEGVAAAELEVTALGDVVDLSAEDHGCQTAAERRAWNRIRAEAEAELRNRGRG